MRFSDTLLAVDPEYLTCLKHENILPLLLYNIRAALNHTVYIWESKKTRAECFIISGGATYLVLWSNFCFVVF